MTVLTTSRLLSGLVVLAVATPAFAQNDPTAAAVAAAAAATAPTREIPQTLPTTGDGAVITGLLTDFCLPTTKGADVVATAKKLKLKLDKKTGEYIVPMGAKPYQVSILAPSAANPTVCQLTVRYALGTDQTILDAVNVWRFLHTPQMVLRRNDAARGYAGGQVRITTAWDNYARQMIDGKLYGIAVAQIDLENGSPSSNGAYDEAIVVYNNRPPVEPTTENAGEILQEQQRRAQAQAQAQAEAEAAAAAAAAAQAPTPAPVDPAAPAAAPAPAPAL